MYNEGIISIYMFPSWKMLQNNMNGIASIKGGA